MDANNFDQFSRAFGRGISRRGLLALLMGAVGLRARDTGAAQLTPPACGQAGAVCTMLAGCCEGFTCVTSTINVNYGVCASGGESGTVAGTTSLVSPFAEGAEQQVASAATDTSTTSTTDPQAERDAEIAQRKARKDAHRSKIQSRKNQQQLRRENKKDDRVLDRRPGLDIALTLPAEDSGDPEVVRVRNNSNNSVFLSRIHRLKADTDGTDLSRTLGTGQLYFFLSGIPIDTQVDSDELLWRNEYVCTDPTDGFIVTAGRSSSSKSHEFMILCDGTLPGNSGRRRKRNKNQNRKRAKKRQQHKSKAKQGKKGRRG